MYTILLSPVDYMFTGAASQPITFAFLYKTRLDPDKLRSALSKTLRVFPIIPSALMKSDDQNFEFQPSTVEPLFTISDSNDPFSETADIRQYITPVESREGQPLSRLTLTQTPTGSVLAASISHALLDGFSYFHLLSSWARTCRGDRVLAPSLDRDAFSKLHDGSGPPITSDDMIDRCGLFIGGVRKGLGSQPVQEDRFFLSKKEIKSYLEDAKKENPDISLTENHMITAFLWKKYIPMWSDGIGDPLTHVTCPFDFRRVLRSVPRTYLGCALCFATASVSYNRLYEASLAELALLIKASIKSLDQEHILASLATLEAYRRQNGLTAMEKIHLRHPEQGMIVTNLTRMPIDDMDFGSGTPKSFLMYKEVLKGAAIFPAQDGVEVVVAYPIDEGFQADNTP